MNEECVKTKSKKIAIVGAMDCEIEYMKDIMEKEGGVLSCTVNKFQFYFGTIKGKEIILVKSGVGRVSAAMLLTTLVSNFRGIDKVINIGIAGGYSNNLTIGDIVVGKNTVYGDVDLRCVGDYVYGQMSSSPAYYKADVEVIEKLTLSGLKFRIGTICSCEKFTTDFEESTKLIKTYFDDLNVLAFDMESACFAQACNWFDMPFIAIRAISDVIGDENQAKKYKDCFAVASKQSNLFLERLLEIL